jgi:hypothetical protein
MVRISRYIYQVLAWLFVAGVVTQVFLAGMVVVAGQISWESHIGLGHSLGGLLLLMLISMYLGRLPGSMKRLTWVLFGVYVLQADILIFLRVQAPLLSALHPVLALFDFALGLVLTRQAWSLTRKAPSPASVSPGLEPSSGS